MAPGNFLFSAAHNCGFSFTHLDSLRCSLAILFFIFFWRILLFQVQSLLKTLPSPASHNQSPSIFGIAVIFICCLVFAAVSFIQQTCKILSGRLHTDCHWFQTAVFLQAPCVFSWRSILIWEPDPLIFYQNISVDYICCVAVLEWCFDLKRGNPTLGSRKKFLYAFSNEAKHLPVPANLLLSEMDIPFYTWPVCFFNIFFVFSYSRILSSSIWLYRKRQQPNVLPRSIFCSSVG